MRPICRPCPGPSRDSRKRARKRKPGNNFPPMKTLSMLLAICVAGISVGSAFAQETPAGSPRPRIVGISHAAFFVSDMAKARAFYEGFLGFQSPFSIPRNDPTTQLVWIKINDRQSIELFPGSEVAPDADRLNHIAVEVE